MNNYQKALIEQYGSMAKARKALRERGALGGATKSENTKKRGFGSHPELARQMGLAKRGKTKKAAL